MTHIEGQPPVSGVEQPEWVRNFPNPYENPALIAQAKDAEHLRLLANAEFAKVRTTANPNDIEVHRNALHVAQTLRGYEEHLDGHPSETEST